MDPILYIILTFLCCYLIEMPIEEAETDTHQSRKLDRAVQYDNTNLDYQEVDNYIVILVKENPQMQIVALYEGYKNKTVNNFHDMWEGTQLREGLD